VENMPLKVEPLEEPYLNMTPLVDVILNLLIFFMLGTSFAKDERQFDVELPTVSHAQSLTNPPDEIVVNVFADGHVVVNQKPLTAEELESLLVDARDRFADQAVMIRGDGKGNYQSIMDVLSVCQKAGIHNYSLATLQKSDY
jgi:biopolymer transport protein ExbD